MFPLLACVSFIYLSASPYSLSLLPLACCYISHGSITAARNDITRYILSHLLFLFILPLPSCLSSFPLLSLFPSYSHCHRYMVSAPSRKSACWLGPACWVEWTPLLLGRSCWSDRSQEPGGTGSSEPPSHRGTLRKRLTHDSLNMLQWSRQKWLPAYAVNVFKERLPDHTFEKEGLVPVGV